MSDKVRCTVTSCTFNRRRHCGASDIQVQGFKNTGSKQETCCATYMLEGSPEAAAWIAGPAEFKSGVTQLTDNENMKPMVYCNVANCRYYEKGCCQAPELEIENQNQGGTYETMCHTFQGQG